MPVLLVLPLLALIIQCFGISENGYASSSGPELPAVLHYSVPQIQSCRQLIVVTTKSWNDAKASVKFLERTQVGNTPWREVGKRFPGMIGKSGFAWGIGLHGTGEPGAPRKQEGDDKSPAGAFRLYSVFGTANPDQVSFLRFPYKQVTSSTEAIDDPRSQYYNRIVDRSGIKRPDWSSSESMIAVGGRYRLGVMIEHNWSQIPGFGSCIFLHVWDRDQGGTAGCTAVSLTNLKRLLHWLDTHKNPLIVQLPSTEYARLKQSWELP
jgi:L,D-peptidoglycan transpeptidase YkuD (ErfK/YbiS/YcfS/YnhG family)